MSTYESMLAEVEAARTGTHPHRLMRVTLDCGHYKLMPKIDTAMGIGAFTGCRYCPVGTDPMVVNVEETGVPGSYFRQPARVAR